MTHGCFFLTLLLCGLSGAASAAEPTGLELPKADPAPGVVPQPQGTLPQTAPPTGAVPPGNVLVLDHPLFSAVHGSAGGFSGAAASSDDVPTVPLVLRPELAFGYLVPQGRRNLGLGTDPRDLTYGSVFYPKLDIAVNYVGVKPGSFTVSAAYLRLDGDRDRLTTLGGGLIAREESDSKLDLIVADLVGVKWPAEDKRPHYDKWWQAGVSIRYATLDQRFNSRVTQGASVTILNATQNFNGIGISAMAGCRLPLTRTHFDRSTGDPPCLYSNIRGSLLAGPNRKASTLQVPGQTAINIESDERSLVPVGEAEFGFAWGTATASLLRWGYVSESNPTIVGLKVAAVGQFWGNVGYLSAARPSQSRFNAGDLYLYGAVVTVYVKF